MSRSRLHWLLLCVASLLAACPAAALTPLPPQPEGVPWPTETWPTGPLPAGTDQADLDAAVTAAFKAEEQPYGWTRAVVIVQGGRVVLERYADGFGPDMRLVSWSAAKSFTHAFVGVAVAQGRVDIDRPMGNPRSAADDPRSAITWRQWLNMDDGQRYEELDAKTPTEDDAARMLFGQGRLDVAAYAASLPLAHPPGTYWNYNSAGVILVCDALTAAAVGQQPSPDPRRAAMLAWMRAGLFEPLGMRSAQPEFDATGLYIGSSFVYATARDFARFGLLYLRDGIWDGRRLLPEGWVDFARTPGPATNADVYGAGWWVTPATGNGRPIEAFVDTGPQRNSFRAEGRAGQIILVVPSKDLVVVRLGSNLDSPEKWQSLYVWMGRVARAFPDR